MKPKPNDLTLLHRIMKETKTALKNEVKIGVPADAGTYKKKKGENEIDGPKTIEVAIWHEFGTKKGIPRRSFLRMPFIEKQAELNKQINRSWEKIVTGKGTAINELGRLGIFAEEYVIDKAFETGGFGKWKKLDPRTVKRKNAPFILIDTNQLQNSIKYWVLEK
ncbi:hypothetical protein [Aliarcobacter lanthieri]|uniref:hypothetical protein n=1 Tax=Aliarcobacter lanthieri TaxID=1355374 RepID=UPI0004B8FDC4|nr:hypothetical protein [Aliarcobacter lanthieri]MBL3520301.1 hypothetical protein [Aliarcobacter lanthieri]